MLPISCNNLFVCKFLIVLLWFLWNTGSADELKKCPSPGVQYGKNCYLFLNSSIVAWIKGFLWYAENYHIQPETYAYYTLRYYAYFVVTPAEARRLCRDITAMSGYFNALSEFAPFLNNEFHLPVIETDEESRWLKSQLPHHAKCHPSTQLLTESYYYPVGSQIWLDLERNDDAGYDFWVSTGNKTKFFVKPASGKASPICVDCTMEALEHEYRTCYVLFDDWSGQSPSPALKSYGFHPRPCAGFYTTVDHASNFVPCAAFCQHSISD